MEEIVLRYTDAKINFQKAPKVVTESFKSTMKVEQLTKLKTRLGLPGHVNLIPPGDDEVWVNRPGFCAL